MDLEVYATRMNAYRLVFSMLAVIREFKAHKWESRLKKAEYVKDTVTQIRRILDNPEEYYLQRIKNNIKVEVCEIARICDIQLPLDNLTVCSSILDNFSKMAMLMPKLFKTKTEPVALVVSDFLRNKHGKIVVPFDHWREIVEIFLLNHLRNKSLRAISQEFQFKTLAKPTSSKKALEKPVRKALEEADKLIAAALSNNFPPDASDLWLPSRNKD